MRDGRAALLCVVLAACSYDWSPGAASPDASADGAADGGGGDDALSGTDAPGVDSLAVETGVDVVEEPPSCAQLEAQVAQAFAAAIACTPTATPSPCKVTWTDACGCTVDLAEQGAATGDYQSAVSALKGSSCALGCTGSCGPARTGVFASSDASFVAPEGPSREANCVTRDAGYPRSARVARDAQGCSPGPFPRRKRASRAWPTRC